MQLLYIFLNNLISTSSSKLKICSLLVIKIILLNWTEYFSFRNFHQAIINMLKYKISNICHCLILRKYFYIKHHNLNKSNASKYLAWQIFRIFSENAFVFYVYGKLFLSFPLEMLFCPPQLCQGMRNLGVKSLTTNRTLTEVQIHRIIIGMMWWICNDQCIVLISD